MNALFQSWTPEQIASHCGGDLHGTNAARANTISNDSRTAASDALFVALKAERDGHEFIDSARSRGVKLFLVEREQCPEPRSGEAFIAVDETFSALGRLGNALWEAHRLARPERRTLGITGSNGKTTSKDFAGALLEAAFGDSVLVTRGNLNSHIGLPMMLADLSSKHAFVVLELGASQPGDIEFLVNIAPLQRALVTSIGTAHLGGFGSRDAVVAEKGRILGGNFPADIAVIPITEPGLVPADFAGELRTFGVQLGSTVQIVSYQPGPPVRVALRLSAPLVTETRTIELTLGLLGRHNAMNIAGVLAALWDILPPNPEALVGKMAQAFSAPEGRLRFVEGIRGSRILDDCYNANPASVAAGIDVLRESEGNRWAILGDMLELGEQSAELHREAGRYVAEAGCECLWTVGQFADQIALGAKQAGLTSIRVFADADEAAHAAEEAVTNADVVLVKGSRAVHLEVVVDRLSKSEQRKGGKA